MRERSNRAVSKTVVLYNWYALLFEQSNPANNFWKDVRVVDGAVLERLCTERYRGFESPSFRYRLYTKHKTFPVSPGAMQEVTVQPRQVRKKAAADG